MTESTTYTLEVPGAVLAYDVRPGTDDTTPLVMVASPQGAAGFATLAAVRDTQETYQRGLAFK